MTSDMTRRIYRTFWLAFVASTTWTQTLPSMNANTGLPVSPVLSNSTSTLANEAPVGPAPQLSSGPASAVAPATVVEGCRPLTDKAIAADMKAVTAQSQKSELTEQDRLLEESIVRWSQALAQCDGRAKERAQRNLADSQKARANISEQLGSGPQCAAAHKDASALQDIARQALSERRWSDASLLFRKAENMWDIASERCTGSQQDVANRRREQSDIDGQNAEFCAPLFDKAREQTQKFRAVAGGLSREEKLDASMVAETLWRDAASQCKGAAAQDPARNNAQSLARERGTPWVARTAPTPIPATKRSEPLTATASKLNIPEATIVSKPVVAPISAVDKSAIGATSPLPASKAEQAEATPGEFVAGTTRFSGQFKRDADSPTYSGNGKVMWAIGDVYEGPMVKSQRHGKGAFVWANGQRYNGDWLRDKPTGQANVKFVNGDQYEGSVVESVPDGQGSMLYATGDTYVGKFKAGEPDRTGVYRWTSGQQFEGDWKNGRPNGQGKLSFATGNIFDGNVVDGVPNGSGRMLFATGETYVGSFLNGVPDGLGTFNWTQGDKYIGQWKAGKKHGQGTFSWKSGDLWEGIYENDVQSSAEKSLTKN